MDSEMGMVVMYGAHIVAVLLHMGLWLAVAGVALRVRSPRARLALITAGATGALFGLLLPILSSVVFQLLSAAGNYDVYPFVSAAVTTVGALLSIIPWGLLLFGLWQAVGPEPAESTGSAGPGGG